MDDCDVRNTCDLDLMLVLIGKNLCQDEITLLVFRFALKNRNVCKVLKSTLYKAPANTMRLVNTTNSNLGGKLLRFMA